MRIKREGGRRRELGGKEVMTVDGKEVIEMEARLEMTGN